MLRRFLLVLSSGLVCSTGFLGESRAKAGSSTEVEVAGSTGQSAGGWVCGPTGAVRYGGLAAQIRHSERRPTTNEGIGTTLVVGAAVEGQRVVAREHTPVDLDPDTPPLVTPQRAHFRVLGAGHLRVGYHFQYVGLEGGVALLSGIEETGRERYGVVPIGELSLGRRDVFYVVAGVGPSQLTNQFALGLPYAGVGVPLGEASLNLRLSLDAHIGFTRTPPRVDAFWTVPLSDSWSLRGGFALGGGQIAPAHEASLGFTFRH